MVLNIALRQAAARMASRQVPPLAAPAALARRTYATPTDGNKQTQTPKPSKEADVAPAPAAAPEEPLPKSTKRGSSAFDIDTSASPLAEQLIESSQESQDGKQSKTGAKAKGAHSMSSIEKRRQNTTRLVSLLVLVGLGYYTAGLGTEFKTQEEIEKFKDAEGADSFLGRVKLRTKAMWEDVNNPVFEKLLPDPLPFPYSRPYTLVIDLDDLLIHSEWSRDKGWRIAKRPGVDYFLGYLAQFYEIVLFTNQPFFTAGPIIEKLDPHRRMITYTLFKESCKTVDGKLVKDISYLNRDPSKVIMLDTNPESVSLQPENAILLPPWKGQKDDTDLAGMVAFFEAIGIYGIPDVRKTIKAYEGTHIPTEHAKRTKELREHELAEKRAQSQRLGSLSVFGGMRSGSSSTDKTWYEQERERYQLAYAEDQKYWRENGEELLRQAKEEQERQIKEMKLNAWSVLAGMGGRPPDAGEGNSKQ